MTFPTDDDRCKDEFIKTGMWPNEVMYQLWRRAWAAALACHGSIVTVSFGDNSPKPPCAVCGKPFTEHGSYPTYATHHYTATRSPTVGYGVQEKRNG